MSTAAQSRHSARAVSMTKPEQSSRNKTAVAQGSSAPQNWLAVLHLGARSGSRASTTARQRIAGAVVGPAAVLFRYLSREPRTPLPQQHFESDDNWDDEAA